MSGSYDSILRAPPSTAPEDVALYPPTAADLIPLVFLGMSPGAPGGIPEDIVLSPMGLAPGTGSYLLTGLVATTAQGTLAPTVYGALVGLVASTAIGTLTTGSGDIAIAATGQVATTAQGSLAPEVGAILAGNGATSAQGTLVPEVGAKPLGQVATGSLGLLKPELGVGITGQSATGAQGALTPAVAVVITGLRATTAQGVLTTSGQAIFAVLTGIRVTLTQGPLLGIVSVAKAVKSSDLFLQTRVTDLVAFSATAPLFVTTYPQQLAVTTTSDQRTVLTHDPDLVA